MTWCNPGKTHRYDFHSGYCVNCGRQREDGREVTAAGTVISEGPEYSSEELAEMLERGSRR